MIKKSWTLSEDCGHIVA